MKKFSIASASVIGSEHARFNLNNQDSLLVTESEDYLMGIVSDGCGSSHYSEVGSNLMVRLSSKLIPQSLNGIAEANVTQVLKNTLPNLVNPFSRVIDELADDKMRDVDGHGSFVDSGSHLFACSSGLYCVGAKKLVCYSCKNSC